MSFLYIRPYLSVIDDNRCPISIYSRFLIALFILGIGLTASIVIKETPLNKAVSKQLNVEEAAAPVKGCLESYPRDFELTSPALIELYRVPVRSADSNSESIRYAVNKQLSNPNLSMDKKYPGAAASDSDDRPSLPSNYCELSEEELLKRGYRRHITVNGDRLDMLAKKYLNNDERWGEIYTINKEKLENENVVPIGIVLIIPPL